MRPSTLGLGTYLGAPDPATDSRYVEAALAFFQAGGTVFDTAANYRGGRSERALDQMFSELPREAFFISSKAGYLPMSDGLTQESQAGWFRRVLVEPGILSPDEVVDGCHAMTADYLSYQLRQSCGALGVSTLDLFHLHNPEHQRPALGPEAFDQAMRKAFEACEGFVQEGRIKVFGCATWNGFRVPPDSAEHLSLENLVRIAEEVGGPDHHFRWIQAPLNLAMPEAFLAPTQRFGGRAMPLLEACQQAGIQVQTSASIMQGRILKQIETQRDALAERFPGCASAAQMALQFSRSCPGVTTALCGMSRKPHVEENAPVMNLPKLPVEALKSLFGN
ncbi:MAG: aldo/keto reductase [Acidobacteriota bacterium]|nr:aldo/keto reductase [Acidobacteriota bacterium]